MKFFWIFLGGGLGSLMRYGLSGYVYRFTEGVFPWGTLAVNLLSGLVIGFLWDYFDTSIVAPNTRVFLFVGILGGFSTFSTYAIETVNLVREGESKLALLNVVLSNAVCIALVFAGFFISRYLKNLLQGGSP